MQFDWDEVWNRKGNSPSCDAYEISGFENFKEFDTLKAVERLVAELGIAESDSLVEIGCGAGLLGRHLKDKCNYVGTDRSPAMVRKAIEVSRISALPADACDLPFKDKSFDHSLAFGIFHYLPSQEAVQKAIFELERLARKTVCISDLPKESHDANHLLFKEEMFTKLGYTVTASLYSREHERFSVLKKL